ncbi:MAG: poly-gamma-glutamate system protein, partial [Candidatus Aminicenantes bacterium]|nr:poly-gamma-glutamate system protein [Candidatus Aminicenantes bacterium]
FPRESSGKNQGTILILFVLSLLFFFLARTIPMRKANSITDEMIEASKIMTEATEGLKECQKEKGISLENNSDINQTGLIGLEFSSITTSVGSLEAKRTTTNPNFAGLIVFLLKEAGVKKGDTIAVGASGSFPGLIVAVLSAAKSMDLRPLVICSLGASQWGANNLDFHWLHMQDCLLKREVFVIEPIELTLGGDLDIGEDMDAEGRALLINDMKESGILFLHESDLVSNVKAKMDLYEEKAGENGIRAFINIGGNWANIGIDAEILKLKPGLVRIKKFPPTDRRGVLYAMAARDVPVIHLLFIKGLVERYGLPWDPVPLPKPGDGKIYQHVREKQPEFFFLAVFYMLLVFLVLFFRNKLNTRCRKS